jgi:hypothetical protein
MCIELSVALWHAETNRGIPNHEGTKDQAVCLHFENFVLQVKKEGGKNSETDTEPQLERETVAV